MRNESGGYEIRSVSDKHIFKSALIERDITVIPGTVQNSLSHVYILEGILDFLSLLQLSGKEALRDDTLILHSVSFFQRAADYILEREYEQISTWLDNDKTGKKNARLFASLFPRKVTSKSRLFLPHEVINAYLQHNFSSSSYDFDTLLNSL